MSSDRVLEEYRVALSLTQSMLAAASRGDWDQLVTLEQQRARQIAAIQERDPHPSPQAANAKKKREVLAAILQLDEQIQLLTQDWMLELRQILSSVQTEQRLSRTYDQ